MRTVFLIVAVFLGAGCSGPTTERQADWLFVNGVVYTATPAAPAPAAVAVRDDTIVFVGTDDEAKRYRGDATRVIDLDGAFLMPGLIDTHVHPLGIVPPGGCDLASAVLTLAELAERLEGCVEAGALRDDGWLVASQWNFTAGNDPDERLPTLRAALDSVSTDIPILLLGNDGHHGGANSAALARAATRSGDTVGLSAATLDGEFQAYAKYVGVDRSGEPNGFVNESARDLLSGGESSLWDLPPKSSMPDVARVLAQSGITTVRDAAVDQVVRGYYDSLAESGGQTFRLVMALHDDYAAVRSEHGERALDVLVERFVGIRAAYADSPLIQADHVKLFVDGVLEGDPRATPPTLPNAAVLRPYHQPRFSYDTAAGAVRLDGYVDTDSAACAAWRASGGDAETFENANGHAPAQCTVSRGKLAHGQAFVAEFMRRFDAAGFTLHAHAIGDRAVRVAADGLGALATSDGELGRAHGLAHAQLMHPDDVARLGALGANVSFTFAWILPDPAYDLTVVPFIDRLESIGAMYDPENYSYRASYPTASFAAAGGIVLGGSDAPVDTRDPRPFVNIEQAVTRADESGRAYNPDEALDIHTAIAAYTHAAADALGLGDHTGWLAVGFKADLIVVDRDIVELAETGRAAEIGDARVLLTMFDGSPIYSTERFSSATGGTQR